MAKRICVMFPDGSMEIMSHEGDDPGHATEEANYARNVVKHFNKDEADAAQHARFGQIEVDLMSFKEMH